MHEFDIGLSFAGADRNVVEEFYQELKRLDLKIFYDIDCQSELLGEDLLTVLCDVYQKRCLYTAIFVSPAYAVGKWPKYEWGAIRARHHLRAECLIPIIIKKTELLGLFESIGHIDLNQCTIAEAVKLIFGKIKGKSRINKTVRDADALFREGEFREVVGLLEGLYVSDAISGDHVALRLLSDAYMSINDNINASKVLKKVVEIFIDDENSLFLLGVAFFRSEDYESAILSYEKALHLNPNHGAAQVDLENAKEHCKKRT